MIQIFIDHLQFNACCFKWCDSMVVNTEDAQL